MVKLVKFSGSLTFFGFYQISMFEVINGDKRPNERLKFEVQI